MPAPIVGAEFELDPLATGSDTRPNVAARVDGRFAVVYENGTSEHEILSLNADGSLRNRRTLNEDAPASLDDRAEIVALPNNGVAVVLQDAATGNVMMYTVDQSLSGTGSHDLNGITNWAVLGTDLVAAVGPNGNLFGGFAVQDSLVAWVRTQPYGTQTADSDSDPAVITQLDAVVSLDGNSLIYAYVDGAGTLYLFGSEVGQGANPDLEQLAGGDYALVYTSTTGVQLRITDRSGNAIDTSVGGGFATSLATPSVTALADGRMLVMWVEIQTIIGPGGSTTNTIMGRMMNADGTADSGAFVIDTASSLDLAVNLGTPRAAQLADGRIIVTYQDGLSSDVDINARFLDPRTAAVDLIGSIYDDDHIGTAFNDTFTGLAGNDRVAAGAGNDRLFGGLGNDTLNGEAGNDTFFLELGNDAYNGGANIDFLDATGSTAQVIVDLAGGVVVSSQYGTDTITLVENATTGSGNDIFAGNALVNVLDGGAGTDTISYYQVSGNVIIDLAGNTGVDGTSTDTLLNFENANGGHGNDQMSGRQSVANVLNGLDNGAAGDTISYYLDNVSVAINLGTNSSLQNGVTDTLLNFENANGSRVGDSIVGNGGANVLNGLGGSDFLTGGGGNDRFEFARGQAAGDAITDFAGNGSGAGDTLRFTGYGAGATFTFVSGNTWRIHSAVHNSDEFITINGGAGAVHATDYVFA